jgi:hypothetical protein
MTKPKRSTIKRRLWRLVSTYIRTKYLDDDGLITCVACGVRKPLGDMDASHFISKNTGMAVYFVEENIHPTCVTCNRFLEGNIPEYYKYMLSMYGQDKIDELIALSKSVVKVSTTDLLTLESEYKARYAALGSTT